MRLLCCTISILMTANLCPARALPEAQLTVRLIEEDGRGLPGVEMVVGFSEESHRGSTDTNGCFTATGKELYGDPGFSCSQVGWYESRSQYRFAKVDTNSSRWLPWNPVVTMVVRRVVNPIPMYWKRVESTIPAADRPCGYDLMIGDWVSPDGRGVHRDLVFTVLKRRVVCWTDFEASLLVTFSGEKDGFVRWDRQAFGASFFLSPYCAPLGGYSRYWHMTTGYDPARGRFQSNDSVACSFRVRTVTDNHGNVVLAHYGSIIGPIEFDGRNEPAGWIRFAYYVNPTPNDRNLEFDPKRNLFEESGPTIREQPLQ